MKNIPDKRPMKMNIPYYLYDPKQTHLENCENLNQYLAIQHKLALQI